MFFVIFSIIIRMQDPLKQGLKPVVIVIIGTLWPHSNARSTKTRIETRFELVTW